MPHDLEPNRALARAKLETLAWEHTPDSRRGRSGTRREVLLDTTEGTGMVPLGELTDFQLRRYIGPGRLEEAGDMRKNGEGQAPELAFIEEVKSRLDIGDRQIRFSVGGGTPGTPYYTGQMFINFYNVPPGHGGAEAENNRLQLQITGFKGASEPDKIKVDLSVRGPSFGDARFKLRAKSGSPAKIADYIADFINMAAKKAPYGHTFGNHEKNAMRKNGNLENHIASTLNLYRQRGEFDGTMRSARECLELAEYEWDADVKRATQAVIDGNLDRRKNSSEENLSFDLQDYGAQMNQWNGGQGDPIYAVGSYAYSGRVHPDREMIESALSQLELLENQTPARKDKLELQTLIDQTEEILRLEQTPNAAQRREEPDETAARELSLYVENEYSLVGAPNSQAKAIEKNLLRKIKNGTFNLELSEKAWMYLMETGAKKYCKEFAEERDWSKVFNKPTRELVAHEFATTFAEENGAKSLARNAHIETEEFDAPAHWASAFINGDTSGLEEEDLAEFEAWCDANPELANVVDVSEGTHFGRFNGLGTELATYTAHILETGGAEDLEPNARIAEIRKAGITHYSDNGQTKAWVEGIDTRGKTFRTEGSPDNAHMQALLSRAKREGVTVKKETW